MIWGASLPYVHVRSFSPETLSATEFGGHGGHGGLGLLRLGRLLFLLNIIFACGSSLLFSRSKKDAIEN